MIVEILLGLILAALVVCGVILQGIDRRLVELRTTWGSIPPGATDYHAKEILNVVSEIAHYLALEQHERERSERLQKQSNDNKDAP